MSAPVEGVDAGNGVGRKKKESCEESVTSEPTGRQHENSAYQQSTS